MPRFITSIFVITVLTFAHVSYAAVSTYGTGIYGTNPYSTSTLEATSSSGGKLPTPVVVPTTITPPSQTTGKTIFTVNLSLKKKHAQVALLQAYLNTHGFPVATKGAGSPGKETTLFGPATKAALIKYQKAHKIKPTSGIFGPLTRAVMNRGE